MNREEWAQPRGRKSCRRCCAETLRRDCALLFGQISPSQRTYASGPTTNRETGDRGDPEGTNRKTRQAETDDDHTSCEEAGLRPFPPNCCLGPRQTTPDLIRHRDGRGCHNARPGRDTGPDARSMQAAGLQNHDGQGQNAGKPNLVAQANRMCGLSAWPRSKGRARSNGMPDPAQTAGVSGYLSPIRCVVNDPTASSRWPRSIYATTKDDDERNIGQRQPRQNIQRPISTGSGEQHRPQSWRDCLGDQ